MSFRILQLKRAYQLAADAVDQCTDRQDMPRLRADLAKAWEALQSHAKTKVQRRNDWEWMNRRLANTNKHTKP